MLTATSPRGFATSWTGYFSAHSVLTRRSCECEAMAKSGLFTTRQPCDWLALINESWLNLVSAQEKLFHLTLNFLHLLTKTRRKGFENVPAHAYSCLFPSRSFGYSRLDFLLCRCIDVTMTDLQEWILYQIDFYLFRLYCCAPQILLILSGKPIITHQLPYHQKVT